MRARVACPQFALGGEFVLGFLPPIFFFLLDVDALSGFAETGLPGGRQGGCLISLSVYRFDGLLTTERSSCLRGTLDRSRTVHGLNHSGSPGVSGEARRRGALLMDWSGRLVERGIRWSCWSWASTCRSTGLHSGRGHDSAG